MKNEILFSVFRPQNKVQTIIRNPSLRVMTLMSGISYDSRMTETGENVFYHFDIGTKQDMEKLFFELDAVD